MRAFSGLLAATMLLTACNGGDNAPVPAAQTKAPLSKMALKSFDEGCGDFLSYTADALTEQYLQPIYCLGFGPCPIFAGAPGAEDAVSGGGAAAPTAPDRVSSTNTQEAGVDEADIVKVDTDGRLYILSGRTLHILEAFPPAGLESRTISSLALADGDDYFYATDFFLDEGAARIVVLANGYGTSSESISVIVDVSDPENPVEVARLSLDGYGMEARRIGSRVHRVSRFDVPAPAWFYDSEDALVQRRQAYQEALGRGDDAAAQQIKTEVRGTIGQRVESAGASAFLPRVSMQASAGTTETTMSCGSIARPDITTGMGLALIDSFNTDATARATGGVINNAYIVYGSAQNLYLAQSSFGWFFARDQAEQTAIYRMQLSETGEAVYRGVGAVDGSIIGRFALSEHAGALRVASTETRYGNNAVTPYNHVTVLDASGGDMTALGAVRDLAPGERIQGVRFVGDRGFVVTFRNIDPLFAIDLSNPARPTVADELKIPGFSSYLLPLGDSHLLTIGRAGNDEQLNGQVAVQLFDVADLADIGHVATVSPDVPGNSSYSYSSAEYDSHAFSYFPDAEDAATLGTLSVPLHSYDYETGEGFSGFLVLRVDLDAAEPLTELGRVSHVGFASGGCGAPSTEGGTTPCRDAVYAADPRRSLFMQDEEGTYLYTLSALGVIASDAAAPSTELGRKELPFDEVPCCFVGGGGGGVDAAPSDSP